MGNDKMEKATETANPQILAVVAPLVHA